jgi:plasmid stability protein
MPMKNITVTVDDKVAEWSRIWAARHQTSVSRMLGELLAEKMKHEERYAEAMDAFLSPKPVPLSDAGDRQNRSYPLRESLHDR